MNTTLKQTTAGTARTITLMLTREEHDRLKLAAEKMGLTISDYLRRAVLEECRRRKLTTNPAA